MTSQRVWVVFARRAVDQSELLIYCRFQLLICKLCQPLAEVALRVSTADWFYLPDVVNILDSDISSAIAHLTIRKHL